MLDDEVTVAEEIRDEEGEDAKDSEVELEDNRIDEDVVDDIEDAGPLINLAP